MLIYSLIYVDNTILILTVSTICLHHQLLKIRLQYRSSKRSNLFTIYICIATTNPSRFGSNTRSNLFFKPSLDDDVNITICICTATTSPSRFVSNTWTTTTTSSRLVFKTFKPSGVPVSGNHQGNRIFQQ